VARIPKFNVVNVGPKGWKVNIPEQFSNTGRRQQRFFPTKAKAEEFAKNLKSKLKDFGTQSRNLSPADTEDAITALNLLKEYNITLTQCARAYLNLHDRKSNAPTLGKAWTDILHKKSSYLRKRAYDNLKNFRSRLPDEFLQTNLYDLTPKKISDTLDQITNGHTAFRTGLRLISSILGDYAKSGIIDDNPCRRVQPPKAPRNDETKIYSIDELRSLFLACKNYEEGLDKNCTSCAVPFAFLAFAGIRPIELTKLNWNNVCLKTNCIKITSNIAKTGALRNVRIHPTLRAWIGIIPETERTGKIVPSRWIQKSTRVRKEAGIDGHEYQDALRHSFGSYLLAIENSIENVKMDMGHEHISTYFKHYHNAVTPEIAAIYWDLTPSKFQEQ
jgi:integrase